MGFFRQEDWSGLPCPPPGDLPDPGIETKSPVSPALQADSLPLSHRGEPHSRWTANTNKICAVLDIVENYGSQTSRWPAVILASYSKFGIKCNVAVGN